MYYMKLCLNFVKINKVDRKLYAYKKMLCKVYA